MKIQPNTRKLFTQKKKKIHENYSKWLSTIPLNYMIYYNISNLFLSGHHALHFIYYCFRINFRFVFKDFDDYYSFIKTKIIIKYINVPKTLY